MSIFNSKINSDLKNIWRYSGFYPVIKKKNRLSLGEGDTPEISVPEITKDLGLEELIFKREDENPNGSHKDRGLAYQISCAREENRKNLIISSSGNAAISAAAYCQKAGIKLFVFVSSKIEKVKLAKIFENDPAMVFPCDKPVTFADFANKKFNIKNIKSSADDNSIYGYKSIGFEIFEHQGEVDSIFLAVSSGTSLLGITAAYKDLLALGEIRKMPQFHMVQTSRIHPLAAHFDKDFKFEREILAKAIVARKVPKEKEVIEAISNSGGSGWIVQNREINNAAEILKKSNLVTSYEGAAALAGIFKAKRKGFNMGKKAVCLLTGKAYTSAPETKNIPREKIVAINSTTELEKFFQKIL